MKRLQINSIVQKIIAIVLCAAIVLSVCAIWPNSNQTDAATDAFEKSIAGFPDSYKPYLRTLHAKYPNWKFIPYNTGIKFTTAVKNEYENDRSLIENAYSNFLKSNASGNYDKSTGKYIPKDGGSWVVASKNCIAYFMDPRNFLDEEHIYMFEMLSFDAATQTQAGIEAILQGSFMYNTNIGYLDSAGKYIATNVKYSAQILSAAQQTKVSAYYIASKILQEIGKSKHSTYAGMGASGSINGNYSSTYKGIYNFYNIGASSGANPIANGLSWAKSGTTYQRPWNTPAKSIVGGAQYIGEKYINCGQNTTYYQRFNVNGNSKYSTYTHQYMTNIYGAASEASYTSDAYTSLGIAHLAKTFVIPVYEDMTPENKTVTLGSGTKTGTAISAVNVRKGASTSYGTLVTLAKGDKVTVKSGVMTTAPFGARWLANPYWYQISVNKNGKTYTGYVAATFISLDVQMYAAKSVKTLLPVKTSSGGKIYYMSSDPSIATVDYKGYITGKKKKNVTIYAFSATGNMSAIQVKITDAKPVTSIALDEKAITLRIGWKKTLHASMLPVDATDKTVKWSTSKKSVATVSSSGKITAKAAGKATITAKSSSGKTAKCVVTVVPKKVSVKGSSKNYNSIKLSWKKRNSVTGYWIYRKNNATGKFVKIGKAKAKASSYIDTKLTTGTAYTYKVRAYKTVSKVKYKAPYSKEVVVTPKVSKTKVTAIGAKQKVNLTWIKSAGASGYRIYRADAEKGTYTLIKDVKSSKTFAYTDSGLAAQKTYYYRVVAYRNVSGVAVEGNKSKIVSATTTK